MGDQTILVDVVDFFVWLDILAGMKERLSEQAELMCRQCQSKMKDGRCRDDISIDEQNLRAEKGECESAVIEGGPYSGYGQTICVVGDMRRCPDGVWIFVGNPRRSREPEWDTHDNEWPT